MNISDNSESNDEFISLHPFYVKVIRDKSNSENLTVSVSLKF